MDVVLLFIIIGGLILLVPTALDRLHKWLKGNVK